MEVMLKVLILTVEDTMIIVEDIMDIVEH